MTTAPMGGMEVSAIKDCIPDNIPEMLRERPHWVNWGVEADNVKCPYNPLLLTRAKAGEKATWGGFDLAVNHVKSGRARGVGYEFNGDGVYGVDLDHVINEDGEITPEAAAIVRQLNSYTEKSLSGTGLHIFVLAPGFKQERERKKDSFVEIYGKAHYIAMTGNIYGGLSAIAERTAELQAVHDKHLAAAVKTEPRERPAVKPDYDTDYQFLKIGLDKDNTLSALWNGSRPHGNESADDQALMNKLAYW
jgi:putative DNA primase/helicase